MKKSLKMITALTLFGLTVGHTTTYAMDFADMIPANWVKRSADHVRETLANSQGQYYVVQWGDTLGTIAEALEIPVNHLVGLNSIQNPDLIIVGTVIYYNAAQGTVTADDRQGNVETVAAATHQLVETEQVPEAVLEEADAQSVNLSPVAPVTQSENLSPVAQVEEVAESAQTPAPAVEATQEPEVTSEPEVASTPEAEPAVAPAEYNAVPEPAEVSEPKTTAEQLPVEAAQPEAPASSTSSYVGVSSAAKEWIAQKESGGDYNAVNPSGKYIGRYQLDASYLNGDHSIENQERVADEYVKNRYGTWEAAKAFWEANGWY